MLRQQIKKAVKIGIKKLRRITKRLTSPRFKNYKAYLDVKTVLSKNFELKESAKSDICFVIGNGPSLKNHDLTAIKGCKIVMNSFYLHPDLKKIDPDFYIFADPEANSIEKNNVYNWWREIANYTNGLTTKFVLPISLINTYVVNDLLIDRKKYFLLFQGFFSQKRIERFNPTKPIPFFQNTLSEGLLLAMYFGYKKIIILGADQDWLSHWNVDKHFYSGVSKSAIGPDITMPYYWWLNAVNTMFQQYLSIQKMALRKGITIVNCSEGGVLDVFPMKMLDQCLREFKN
jgi:hypothetical protein